MATKKMASESTVNHQEETVRLLFLLVKQANPNQSSLILQLKNLGFENKRIAELLGTTANTVNVTAQKAKKKKK